MRISDWSSDVCSSDLEHPGGEARDLSLADSSDVSARLCRALLPSRAVPSPSFRREPSAPRHEPSRVAGRARVGTRDRPEAKGARSEEHPSELQSLMRITYAVFCLKKKNNHKTQILP